MGQGFEASELLSRRELLQGAAAVVLAAAAAPAATAATARALGDPRFPVLERLCDLVIPPTATPGGKGAGAAEFVLLALDHHMDGLDDSTLQRVREHLDVVARRPFLELPREQQQQVLAALDVRAFQSQAPAQGSPEQAWRLLKPAIVAGYKSSEIGASRELVFEPGPETARTNFTLTPDYRSRSNEGFGGSL